MAERRDQKAAGGGLFALSGLLPAGVILATILREYSTAAIFDWLAGGLALATVAVLSFRVGASRLSFVLIGVALTIWAAIAHESWAADVGRAALGGSLIIAMFTALVALRNVAATSAEIIECGRFLARQPPGLRYIALTLGGHLFGLILLYGSISLLGSLATESNADEKDAEIRGHRTRRMLLAIQRGFASTLCWSPMAFSMVIATALIPGASWSGVVLPCLFSTFILLAGGWAMDTIFKPKLSHPAPPRSPDTGRWLPHLKPLLVLLGIVVAGIVLLRALTGVEVIGAVITLIPILSVGWIWLQGRAEGFARWRYTSGRVGRFVLQDLPGYRGEIVLLFMAAFIGSLGSSLLGPLLVSMGVSLASVPPLLIVVALIWIIPLTGQLGMNPILSVSLILPLLPTPEAMGMHPAVIITAVTGGWALSGATSPFTASVLLVSHLAGVPPRRAGLIWNGPYILVMGTVLSLWVALLSVTL
ncbi:hypothetical protein [Paracoccus aerodenitrificans]|uniref:hypothetical protein n=1 Tax=Paracoccus aerodenitrificans TaxID=3017781 RepID=UPI0022F0D90A|nr:hypothetical protein [Paracoccus aerodenitrificans]WBU63483.1 hypothetical protein PAE61_14130 [Paracoccus aerodenitrificans]